MGSFPPLTFPPKKIPLFKIFRNSKKKREIFRFSLWKKISTTVDKWGNLLIIEPKTSGLQGILSPWAFHPSPLGTSISNYIVGVENSK
jgi:hypothetical protein